MKIISMDIFKLYREFWDFAFENPDKIKPNHIAIYSFAIEHCNRLGWKEKYGLPSTMVMEATGIKSYNTYILAFNELIEFGFIKLIEKSKNQYSSNIIALSIFNKAHTKALDKALIKHTTKQSESTLQSNDSIDIQDTNLQKTKNKDTIYSDEVFEIIESVSEFFEEKYLTKDTIKKLLKNYEKIQIIKAIEWAKNDNFWSTNFLSLAKLDKTDKNGVKYIDIFIEKSKFAQNFTKQKTDAEKFGMITLTD